MWALLPVVASVVLPGHRVVQQRPELSGPEQLVELDGLRVHWTDEGDDAPSPTDDDGNGLPDTIDAFVAGLEGGREAFAAEGWRPLAPDDGAGGSDAIDVYVVDTDIFGYATTWPAADGDGWSCFIQLDAATNAGGRVAESVALHELHHCVQFRYTAQTDAWLYEAAATYEQYTEVVDPVLDLAMGVLYGTRLGAPDRPLGDVGGRFEYAGAVFMKFWSEWQGAAPQRLPALWEALAAEPDWQRSLDDEARRQFGVGLDATFLEHAVWNTFACADDDGAHYSDRVLPCVAQVSVPRDLLGEDGTWTVRHDEAPFTSAVLERDGGDALALACDGVDGASLLALDGEGRIVEQVDGHRGESLRVAAADHVRAVIVGTSEAPMDARCALTPSRASTEVRACGTLGGGSGWLWLVAAALVGRRRVTAGDAARARRSRRR